MTIAVDLGRKATKQTHKQTSRGTNLPITSYIGRLHVTGYRLSYSDAYVQIKHLLFAYTEPYID